jgi:hypothetical protein
MNRSIGNETKKIGRLAKVENENMKKLCCKKKAFYEKEDYGFSAIIKLLLSMFELLRI